QESASAPHACGGRRRIKRGDDAASVAYLEGTRASEDDASVQIRRRPTCTGVPRRTLQSATGVAQSATGVAPAAPAGAGRPLLGPLRRAARRPQLTRGPLGALLLGRPELLSRPCLLGGNGLGLGHEQLERLANRDLLAELLEGSPPAHIGQHLFGLASVSLCQWSELLQKLIFAWLDALGLCDCREHRLSPQRGAGLGLGLVGQPLLVSARNPQVRLSADPLPLERRQRLRDQLVRTRVNELLRDLYLRVLDRGVDHRLLELSLYGSFVRLAQPLRDVIA